MLQKRKYITDTIIPQTDVNVRLGKKMFPENKRDFVKLDHNNAGVQGDRIGELSINSRKQISLAKSDSSQMKDVLNHCEEKHIEIIPSKKPLVSYSCYQNQAKYFETKLVPDSQGKMSICVGRKSGSATVNMNIDDYDLGKTYHTWKKIIEKSAPHTRSNLENDRFLTVAEDAHRSDRMPVVKNRNPPVANADGPFESERKDIPRQARDNLDRTLTPKITSQKYENSKRPAATYKNTFSISQPHTYPSIDHIRGVKRNVSHWAHSDRVKRIIHNYSDDECDEMYDQFNPPKQGNVQEQVPTQASVSGVDYNYSNQAEVDSHRYDQCCQQAYTQDANESSPAYDENKENCYSNEGNTSHQNCPPPFTQYDNHSHFADCPNTHYSKDYINNNTNETNCNNNNNSAYANENYYKH